MSLQDSTQIENVKVLLKVGADGRGIAEIVKVGTSGIVDTYDIVLSDETRIPFDVTNGSSIAAIEKTATVGLVDTYTITLTNGDTFEFEVTNADGSTAGTVSYDNSESGLDATNVQDAIDEVNDNKANKTDLTNISQSGATATQAISSGTYFYLNGVLVRAKTDIAIGATFTLNTNYEVKTVGDALVPSSSIYNFSNSKASSSYNIVCRKVGRVATIRFILRASDTIAINEVLATVGDEYKPIDDVYITTYLAGETLFLKTNGQLANSNLSTLATGGYRHCQATYITAS